MGLDIERYLAGSDYVEIKTGQSGAAVYDLDGKKILKHVVRKKLKAGLFDTYCREALFYQCKMQEGASYLPEILDLEISDGETCWQSIQMPFQKSRCIRSRRQSMTS